MLLNIASKKNFRLTNLYPVNQTYLRIRVINKKNLYCLDRDHRHQHHDQEYERAVIFRLGRVKKGGAVGPGFLFVNGPRFSFYFYFWTKVWTRVGPGGMMTNQEMKKEKDFIRPGLS